jgi:GT2 family glycosyltransferase
LERLLFSNVVVGGGSSVTVRRDVFARVGPFDPTVAYGEDWEMWLRAAAAYPFAAVREPLTRRHERRDSYGKATAAMRDACLAFLDRAFDTYAAAYRHRRAAALAAVHYRAAVDFHARGARAAALAALLRTIGQHPLHGVAYRRLLRLAAGR